jgi:hypothetical protein
MSWCQACSAEIAAQTPGKFTLIENQEQAVEWFMKWRERHPLSSKQVEELLGRNLGCWCKIGTPCHADVLLDMVNQ